MMGNERRFVRCECWPNAVIRLFISTEGKDQEPEVRFGVFTLRELELGEEVVLGWERAVEHVVHKLVRDAKLRPLPEDEDVLSDSDTKRPWDILDLLRSLSMTCACKLDASNCAISFGRMLLEAANDAQHAPELGPLVAYKRFENCLEPTLHAVSSKTRRGRESAARERKLRQAAQPPSSPPKRTHFSPERTHSARDRRVDSYSGTDTCHQGSHTATSSPGTSPSTGPRIIHG
ncbi:hypothetical protein RSAG8_11500, partial [Rhizoctonia solani AG-8 WAC10335]